MKRFILKTILLVLPLSLLLVVQEIALRSVPNDYAYKNQWLTENSKQLHILTLGSSHGYFGIQPTEFSKPAFNAGHISQSLLFDEFIYNKFAPQMTSLEYLILPVSYFAIRSRGLQHGDESWRVKNYTIYYDCPYFRYRPSLALECYRCAPRATAEALQGTLDYRSCDSLGRGMSYTLEGRSDDWKSSGPVAMNRHTKINFNQRDVEENLSHIDNMIRACAQKGVMVILLTTPTYRTYYEVLNKEQKEEMIDYCNGFEDKYSNTIYLNWLEHQDFVEEDFYDADHLNEIGAKKLTRLLDQELSKFN